MTDLAILNAVIRTGDPRRPLAQALAASGGRIVAVGRDEDIRPLISPRTRVVDAGGRLVLPGLTDSHTHFLKGGFSLTAVDLRDAGSPAEFARRIAERAVEAPGEWILHGDWDHTRFDQPILPRRDWVDAATPRTPVFVNRLDEHMALANGEALRRAGITRVTPAPAGGEIVKDPATGEPTGILKDAAMDLVAKVVPEPTPAEKARAVRAALLHAAEHGVTSLHDMSDAATFRVYRDLLAAIEPTLRIAVYFPITARDDFEEARRDFAATPFLKAAGLKGFIDGSLGSSTALFFEPYSDDPSSRGLLFDQMFPEGAMEARIREADAAGVQTAIHAIGDRANDILLSIYERVAEANGPRARRFRVEHAQHVRPADLDRFGRAGLVASVQPAHVADDARWADTKIGPERARTSYPYRSLLRSGAVLACGSDWPVASLNPLEGIRAAVTREPLDGSRPGGWVPEQRLTVEEAVRGFTFGGAYAERADAEKGTLEPGKFADLVVLDRDIFSIPPAEIGAAKVLTTVVAGRVVFQKR